MKAVLQIRFFQMAGDCKAEFEAPKSSRSSGVTLLFEELLSQASEIEHLEIFCHPRENQLTQGFLVKVNMLFFLIS